MTASDLEIRKDAITAAIAAHQALGSSWPANILDTARTIEKYLRGQQ